MPDLYFEDFTTGAALPEATLTVTAEDADGFARSFGPGAALSEAESHAPLAGRHVAALGMRLVSDAFIARAAALGAPGIDAVTWPHLVPPGHRLRLISIVMAARASAPRPEMGLVTVEIMFFNQDDTCVMTQENAVMVARRVRAAWGSTETRV